MAVGAGVLASAASRSGCRRREHAGAGRQPRRSRHCPHHVETTPDSPRFQKGRAAAARRSTSSNSSNSEKLSDDNSIHDKDTTYSWAQASTSKVAALNSASFGGHNDWRVPNRFELDTLVDLGVSAPSTYSVFNDGCSGGCNGVTCSCPPARLRLVEFDVPGQPDLRVGRVLQRRGYLRQHQDPRVLRPRRPRRFLKPSAVPANLGTTVVAVDLAISNPATPAGSRWSRPSSAHYVIDGSDVTIAAIVPQQAAFGTSPS